jgi:hypothetical protein
MDSDYSYEEALEVLRKTVDRKQNEIDTIEKKMRRFRKEERREAAQELVDYLRADRTAYLSVIADMTDDDTLLEGLDTEAVVVDCPRLYDDYLSNLSADDLENELDAEEIRADYCDEVVELMCEGIGQEALGNKKMLKVLMDDPEACSIIGEYIFYNDEFYAYFTALMEKKKAKKEKKKAKKKV